MFEPLTYKEKPGRNKPTFDKKDFVSFEISEITVLSKTAIKITTAGDKNDDELAVDIISTVRAILRTENREGKKINISFEKIEHERGSNTFIIQGDVNAFIEMLESASYISQEFKEEIMSDQKFRHMMEAKVPEVKDILAQLNRVYQMLPTEQQVELQKGVAAFAQQGKLENSSQSQNTRKSPQVK